MSVSTNMAYAPYRPYHIAYADGHSEAVESLALAYTALEANPRIMEIRADLPLGMLVLHRDGSWYTTTRS